jgi:hypothetical protein
LFNIALNSLFIMGIYFWLTVFVYFIKLGGHLLVSGNFKLCASIW